MDPRPLLALLLLASVAVAQERFDERNPRAPDQTLAVTFAPWYCTRCADEKRIEAGARTVELMSVPAQQLAQDLGVDRDWIAIESPTFRIFSSLEASKVRFSDTPFAAADLRRLKEIFPSFAPSPQAFVSAHERAHLYQIRLERIVCHFRALAANDLPLLGMGDRFEVYLFEDSDHYRAFTEKALGRVFSPRSPAQRQHYGGERSRFVVAVGAELLVGRERQLNNTVIHHVAHTLAEGHRQYLADVWGWLDGGLAHYYERRESPDYNVFCLDTTDPPREYARADWPRKVRYLVARKKEPNLGTWCDKTIPQQLSVEQHVIAWSFVDWLVNTDPVRVAKLLDLCKDRRRKWSGTDAIREVFGITPEALHDRWREYVLATERG
jgi:hypothetical protein